ncbi:MAG: type II CRISPR-associated endonuclease Cas1 [Lactobacillaceae bacterium]|jgi:CRISPR-associated protein Cas1|nr:type II CRISPR-associated endonuclease Cas1 [Lactobacillaceae bacterium]
MSKRIIVIESAQKVSFSKNAIVVQIDDQVSYFPISTIQAVIFETDHNAVTVAALKCLALQDIPVIFCDSRHLPCATVFPTNMYFERANRLKLQFHLSTQLKKRLWQKIIRQKILNQATVTYSFSKSTAIHIKQLAKLVDEGDTQLNEAVAARIYFKAIVHNNFTRRSKTPLNYFFNYGYAIIRSLITQQLMAHGLEPCIGIWHHGNRNSLNLTYDLIEAFRPFVDTRVLDLLGESELTKENRIYLLELVEQECWFDGKKTTVKNAINLCVDSFVKCLDANSASPLLLPSLVLP